MSTNDWLFAAGMGCLVLGALFLFTIWCCLRLSAASDGFSNYDESSDMRIIKQQAMRNVIHKLSYEELATDERDDLDWHLHSLIYEYRTLS